MNLAELLSPGGSGVIATAAKDGTINQAVYAVPHITGPDTVAWGMTEGRTAANLRENPNAAFLLRYPGAGARGVRFTLKMTKVDESGEMLDKIRARTSDVVSPGAAGMVRYVATFKVVDSRPLM